jgi:hypothetical protein
MCQDFYLIYLIVKLSFFIFSFPLRKWLNFYFFVAPNVSWFKVFLKMEYLCKVHPT